MQVAVQGNFVPVALAQLAPGEEIFCEGGIMVYADPTIQMSIRPFTQGGMGATLRRSLVGGVPFWMHVFHGPGAVAFSRFGPGEVRVLELAPGQTVDIAEHSMILATNSVRYDTFYVHGTGRIGRMMGFWMDRLTGPGTIVYHGHGDIIGFDLKPGEAMQIDYGGLLRKDATVQLQTINQPLGGGIMGHALSFEAIHVTGPGRLEIQTLDPTRPGNRAPGG